MAAVIALLASVLWGTADFLGGRAAKRLPAVTVVAVSQLTAVLGLLPLAAVLGAWDEPRTYVLPGMAAGLAGLLALTAFYRALATGTMGVVAPIAALGVVVPVLAGLLAGEQPGALRLVGIALGVLGVVLASGPELSGGGSGRPLLLAALAGAGFGAVLVLLASGSREGTLGSVVMTLLVMRLTSLAVLGVLLLAGPLRRSRTGPAAARVRRKDLPVLVTVGVFDVGANGAFAVASQSDLVSVTSVLASLYPVVTVLLARRLLAERLTRAQSAGVALALGGVVLLATG